MLPSSRCLSSVRSLGVVKTSLLARALALRLASLVSAQIVDTTNPGQPSHVTDCSSTCGSDLVAATSKGLGAEFQLLLTCIGNAGSFASECAPLACGLTDAFGSPSGCGSHGLMTSSDPDASTGESAACASAGGVCIAPNNFECTSRRWRFFVQRRPRVLCALASWVASEGRH